MNLNESIAHISKKAKITEKVVTAKVDRTLQTLQRKKCKQTQYSWENYLSKVTSSFEDLLDSVQDDILTILISQANLKEVLTTFLQKRGDWRDHDQINIRDYLRQYQKELPDDAARERLLDKLKLNLQRVAAIQLPVLQKEICIFGESEVKLGLRAIRESLALWIGNHYYIQSTRIEWRLKNGGRGRNRDGVFREWIQSVPLLLSQIHDSVDHKAYQEVIHTQYGLHGRNYLWSPTDRSTQQNLNQVVLNPNARTKDLWPSVEVRIDVDRLRKDRYLLDSVFHKVPVLVRECFWQQLQTYDEIKKVYKWNSQESPYEIFLISAHHYQTHVNAAQATIRATKKKQQAAPQCKEETSSVDLVLTEEEKVNLERHKDGDRKFARSICPLSTQDMETEPQHGLAVYRTTLDQPLLFRWKFSEFHMHKYRFGTECWSTTTRNTGTQEMTQLFFGLNIHSSPELWRQRRAFPKQIQLFVEVFHEICNTYLRKSKNSPEIVLILQILFHYLAPTTERKIDLNDDCHDVTL